MASIAWGEGPKTDFIGAEAGDKGRAARPLLGFGADEGHGGGQAGGQRGQAGIIVTHGAR